MASDVVIGEDQQVGDQVGRQQSISITPEMRQRVSMGVPLMQRPKAVPVDRWNAMVPTIREALKSGATPEQVMEQIGDLAKGLDQSQKGAIQGKVQQAYDKIEAARSKESPEKAERLFERLVSFGVRQFHARGGNLDTPSFRAAIIRNYKSISNDVSDADLSEIYAEAQRSYDIGLS